MFRGPVGGVMLVGVFVLVALIATDSLHFTKGCIAFDASIRSGVY